MKIRSALLKPHLLEIESGFLQLMTFVSGQDSGESQDLKAYIENQLRQVHAAKAILHSVEDHSGQGLSPQLFEDSKMMKLRLRFAGRRWRLLVSNQARDRKMRERIDHVASVAA